MSSCTTSDDGADNDTEISLLSNFRIIDSLEADGLNEIITDILIDEQIEKDVKSCVNDLLDKI